MYFLDAVKAYKAGALRGALTSAWVALVYDLIAKYRELSTMGEVTANTQIVNRIARTYLERLREDRHLCAHPAFSAEADLFSPRRSWSGFTLLMRWTSCCRRLDLFDADVQSTGVPLVHDRNLDYVEQRYLARLRAQSIRNFGTVLAKSLLKSFPAQCSRSIAKSSRRWSRSATAPPAAWHDAA